VVKDVPAGVTVVGVPGRLVARQVDNDKEQKRRAIAQKIGFDAYGTAGEMPDPVAHAINCMLDHIHAMDSKMEEMCAAIKQLGYEIGDMQLPRLDTCDIRQSEAKLEQERLQSGSDKVD
jgi:serine O-acetyltransferase